MATDWTDPAMPPALMKCRQTFYICERVPIGDLVMFVHYRNTIVHGSFHG